MLTDLTSDTFEESVRSDVSSNTFCGQKTTVTNPDKSINFLDVTSNTFFESVKSDVLSSICNKESEVA